MPYLKANKSILALDLRCNAGFCDIIHKRVALTLLKNIEFAFKKRANIKDHWIIKPLIFIEIPRNSYSMFFSLIV